jgi:hypothetical protein
VPFRALICPQCGGLLPPNARRSVVTCPYCRASVAFEGHVVKAAEFRQARLELEAEAASIEKVTVGGVPYRIVGQLGRGECCDVFLAERVHRLTERVVLKMLRSPDDADIFEREHSVLTALGQSSAPGNEHFLARVPQLIGKGIARSSTGDRSTLTLRYASGFVHTLGSVRSAYPDGLDARHAVWIWRRILETIGWAHRSGFVHGALLPRHFLVHARDHGVNVIGWSCAVRLGSDERLPGVIEPSEIEYPAELSKDGTVTAATDIAMTARSVLWVLGRTDGTVPHSVPHALLDLLRGCAEVHPGERPDAWDIAHRVGDAARAAFGPPAFVPLLMPGWR